MSKIPNTLMDLNNVLFGQLERLDDEDLTTEELECEIRRAKAMTGISQSIISNASVMLDAQKLVIEYGREDSTLPEALQTEGKKK